MKCGLIMTMDLNILDFSKRKFKFYLLLFDALSLFALIIAEDVKEMMSV